MEKLREQYEKEVIPALMKKFEYKSVMQVPKLDKIVINIGLGDTKENPKSLENAMNDLMQITGQRPVVTKAKKSIAAFKLREGANVGCKVTLRSDKMYDFAYKLFNVALPRVRDFRGVSGNSFDGRGNYSMGIKEQLIFPEIEYDKVDKLRGMDIIFVTTANSDEEAKELSKGYKVVPISMEIMSDIRTPMQVLRILKGVSSHCYMLESVENQEKWGRYTFLGYDPKLEITCTNGVMKVKNGKTEISEVKHPGEKIKEILKEYTSPNIKELPTFTGGLVGYFSYDYIKYSEPKLNLDADDEEGFKDVDLMLFDKVIAFDNFSQKIIVIANAKTDNLEEDYNKCVDEINKIIELIKTGEMVDVNPGKITSEFRPLFTEKEYCEMVEKAKHYIYEGDIFQVVLSNRLEADYEGSLLNAYRVLRTINEMEHNL